MANLDQGQLAQIVAAVIQQVQGAASPKPAAKPHFLPKGSKADAGDLAAKDASLVSAFHRKGFRDVVLKDRSNPSADYNIRPFKGWLEQGRIVRKGEKSIKGLFHITQTMELPNKPSAQPAISAEQKALFVKAKAAFRARKGKPQPTLV